MYKYYNKDMELFYDLYSGTEKLDKSLKDTER